MPLIQTGDLTPQALAELSPFTVYQIYNGLDCCLTQEIFQALEPSIPEAEPVYSFERALQGPFLEIMNRGFLVDQGARAQAALRLRQTQARLAEMLNRLAGAVWGKPLNPASPAQLQSFFYKAMKLPEVFIIQKGVRRVSTNLEALETLDQYLYARPFIGLILELRSIAKQLQLLECQIDSDGRFRTSYNIAGTETGRLSSSTSVWKTGGNAQNIEEELRWVFQADPGMKIFHVDLEQVEARDVGFLCGCLFGDWAFLDSCESGDLHTQNAKRIWPELGWPGDRQGDRKVADQIFYRGMTYRDMAKRGSHLSNYSGTAATAAKSLKVPLGIMEDFQARYCRGLLPGDKQGRPPIQPAYPAIPLYWQWVATQLQSTRILVTPFGRRRHFFGRPDDPATLREAIAFVPQSTTADRTNLGLWRVWAREPSAQLLAQTHDSITGQAPDNFAFGGLVNRVLQHIQVELVSPSGRSFTVPGEAKVGYNWGSRTEKNPRGLVKWKG